jgi:hypothetical protein
MSSYKALLVPDAPKVDGLYASKQVLAGVPGHTYHSLALYKNKNLVVTNGFSVGPFPQCCGASIAYGFCHYGEYAGGLSTKMYIDWLKDTITGGVGGYAAYQSIVLGILAPQLGGIYLTLAKHVTILGTFLNPVHGNHLLQLVAFNWERNQGKLLMPEVSNKVIKEAVQEVFVVPGTTVGAGAAQLNALNNAAGAAVNNVGIPR